MHVPKCAGTTVRSILQKFDTRNNFYWQRTTVNNSIHGITSVDKAHMPAKLFKIYFRRDFDLHHEYCVFAMTRNPWSRLISAFYEPRQHLLPISSSTNPSHRAIVNGEFYEYISGLILEKEFTDNAFVHATPQYMYHYIDSKKITDVLISIEKPDLGFRQLQFLCPDIAKILSNSINRYSANQKSGIHDRSPLNYMPGRLIAKLKKIYYLDFQLFGYNEYLDIYD